MMSNSKKLKTINIYIFLISVIFINFIHPLNINSEAYKDHKENKIKTQIKKDRYILGPGDELYIYFLNNKEFNGNYKIINDGTISLPFINSVFISGKTLEESTIFIEERLNKEFINAKIFLNLTKTRPVNVSIIGEVVRPGYYSLDAAKNATNISKETNLTSGLPTLVDLIKRSGGITNNSDLENIELVRKLSDSYPNQYKKTKVNFIKFLFEGDQSQNPNLFDGDILRIPEGKSFDIKSFQVSRANLSPDIIKVHVIGEVVDPGSKDLNANVTLTEAIYAAGGISPTRGQKYNIELYRINNDGSSSYKKFRFHRKKGFSEKVNPQLSTGDVIRVNRNLVSTVGDSVKPITEPLTGILSIIRLIDILGN